MTGNPALTEPQLVHIGGCSRGNFVEVRRLRSDFTYSFSSFFFCLIRCLFCRATYDIKSPLFAVTILCSLELPRGRLPQYGTASLDGWLWSLLPLWGHVTTLSRTFMKSFRIFQSSVPIPLYIFDGICVDGYPETRIPHHQVKKKNSKSFGVRDIVQLVVRPYGVKRIRDKVPWRSCLAALKLQNCMNRQQQLLWVTVKLL